MTNSSPLPLSLHRAIGELLPTMDPSMLRVRSSQRASRLRVEIDPQGQAVITIPTRCSTSHLENFLRQHADWIASQCTRIRAARADEPLLPAVIHLAAVEQQFAVHYIEGSARLRELGDTLLVSGKLTSTASMQAQLRKWLQEKARLHLRQVAKDLSGATGLQPKRLQVRLQRSRWGSCSAQGTISLNAALLLRSPAELRYVVVHELCHLRQLNHSGRFWKLVGAIEPDFARLDRELNRAWSTMPCWVHQPGY